MQRRTFNRVIAATAATPLLGASHRRRRRTVRLASQPERWSTLERLFYEGQDQSFPPGVADGTITFFRQTRSSWQRDELIVYQMHANGHTYRHNGHSLDSLSPGVWVHGPTGDLTYSGISSVLEWDGELWAFAHDERRVDQTKSLASVGVLKAADWNGYHQWTRHGSDLVPVQEARSEGFIGSTMPTVVKRDDELHMFYTNRFGNGRHNEVWWATADNPAGPWERHGAAIVESGDHYYAEGVTVVWSTVNRRWILMYSTDKATRYCYSDDLESWSAPQNLFTKPAQWLQTDGYWRWYDCLLDESQDHSGIVGSNAMLSEHWLNAADYNDRFPMLTRCEIR